jgi:Peptidase A4 family
MWEKAFRSGTKMVQAELAHDPIMSRRNPLYKQQADFRPTGWGGVVVLTSTLGYSPAEPANMVYGQWTQPYVYPLANPPAGPQTVGFWVGLDGYGNGQVLQAGTAVTVNGNTVNHWAWTEWYPNSAVQITNFPVAPGNVITCLVCAPQSDHGFVSMMNERTQQAVSVGLTPPPGITSIGASAEWIVEGISDDLIPFDLFPLPIALDAIIFGGASAGTKNHSFDMQPKGFTTNIVGNGGAALTQALIGSPSAAIVFWEGLS